TSRLPENVLRRVVTWPPNGFAAGCKSLNEFPICRVQPSDPISPNPTHDHRATVIPDTVARHCIDVAVRIVCRAAAVLTIGHKKRCAKCVTWKHRVVDLRYGAPRLPIVFRLDDATVPGLLHKKACIVRRWHQIVRMAAYRQVKHAIDTGETVGFPVGQ